VLRVRAEPRSSERIAEGRRARSQPTSVERVLALQRGLGNHQVAQLLGRRTLSRELDVYTPKGVGSAEDLALCEEFATIVSELVDGAHDDLVAGRVSKWKGAKLAAFLHLLNNGNRMAVTHAGNVIEERVYYLMRNRTLPAPWTPQFTEGMGGASRPDIVINLTSGHIGLVDVTSERGHILAKAGGWLTSSKYIYVAEAWFPSITADHLPRIRKAIAKGGITDEALEAMQEEVAQERQARAAERQASTDEARELFRESGNMSQFALDHFDGSKAEASKWLRVRGVSVKGMSTRRPKRGLTLDQKRKKRRQAVKKRRELEEATSRKKKAEELRDKKRYEKVKAKRNS
jgi:hypothetical protein